MTNITVTVDVQLGTASIGNGITPGNYRLTVLNADGSQAAQQTVAEPADVQFNLAPGVYTVFAQRLDNNGNPIDSPVSQKIQVVAQAVSVPRSLAITGAQLI